MTVRLDARLDAGPKFRRAWTLTKSTEDVRVELLFGLEDAGAIGARVEVLLDFQARLRVQLGIEIRPEKLSDFVTSHGVAFRRERISASRILWRARNKFPITLPSGMSSDSA